jgi:hypothetical protein
LVVVVFFAAARDAAGLAVVGTVVVLCMDRVVASVDDVGEVCSDDVVATMIGGPVVASQPCGAEGTRVCPGDVLSGGGVGERGSGAKVSATTRTTVNSRCTTLRCSDVMRIPASGS